MVRAQESVVCGPWPKGLVNRVDPVMVSDDALYAIENFDFEVDGTLKARGSIQYAGLPDGSYLVGAAGTGYGNSKEAIVKDGESLQFWRFVSNAFFPDNPTKTSFTGLTTQAGYYAVLTYDSFDYYLNVNAAACFRVPLGFTSGAVTFVSTIPAADTFEGDNNAGSASPSAVRATDKAFLFKDRMWVIGFNNRVYFSKATDPTVWAAPDGGFFDINPGDGDAITCSVVSNDVIYFFKRRSVWVFSFNADPATDGVLQKVSDTYGAIKAVTYKNRIFLVSTDAVYEFTNGSFQNISEAINFGQDRFNYPVMAVWADKLVLSLGGGNVFQNNCFVYDLKLEVWSTYSVTKADPDNPDRWSGGFYALAFCKATNFFTDSYSEKDFLILEAKSLLYIVRQDADAPDIMVDQFTYPKEITYIFPKYTFTTKNFTLDDEFSWKRLHTLKVQGRSAFWRNIAPGIFENVPGRISLGAWYLTTDFGLWNQLTLPDGFTLPHANQDFDKINVPSCRFKSLQLKYESFPRRVGTDYEGFGTAFYPIFHKLQLRVSQHQLTSK